jgi:hypothetical protein
MKQLSFSGGKMRYLLFGGRYQIAAKTGATDRLEKS